MVATSTAPNLIQNFRGRIASSESSDHRRRAALPATLWRTHAFDGGAPFLRSFFRRTVRHARCFLGQPCGAQAFGLGIPLSDFGIDNRPGSPVGGLVPCFHTRKLGCGTNFCCRCHSEPTIIKTKKAGLARPSPQHLNDPCQYIRGQRQRALLPITPEDYRPCSCRFGCPSRRRNSASVPLRGHAFLRARRR